MIQQFIAGPKKSFQQQSVYKSPKLVFFCSGPKKYNTVYSLIMFDDEGNVQYYR